jgi:tetratricopeptide (TPR) repeat protein
MPNKVRILWIICCFFTTVAFLYASAVRSGEETRAIALKAENQKRQVWDLKKREMEERIEMSKGKQAIAEKSTLGQYDEVIRMAQEALKTNPADADAYMWWGLALVKQDQKEEALVKFEESAKTGPGLAKNFVYWGLTLTMLGRNEEALAKFQDAVRSDPTNSNAFAYWGAALMHLQRYEDAVDKLQEALTLNKFNEAAYASLVDVYTRSGGHRKAWEAVARARAVKIEIPKDLLETLARAMPEPR